MISAVKSELRKLLSVRSTYFIVLICLLIVAFFAGFGDGFRAGSKALLSPDLLAGESRNAIEFGGFIMAFAGLLLAGHEYRYNTIFYTLTSINRRYKVLLAKVAVVTLFTVVVGTILIFFSPLCAIVGTHLAGKHIGTQTFEVWPLLWRCLFCGWAYAMYAFILLMILRNQVGAIVTFLIFPLIGENLLMQIFKHSGKYLPFTSAQAIVEPTGLGNHTTTAQAAVTALTYIVTGLVISGVLFVRRDAN